MEDYRDVFTNYKWSEQNAFQRKIQKIEDDRSLVDTTLSTLRNYGIVLLDNPEVQRLFQAYDIDLYKICEAKCKQWGRPYIKCAQTGYNRITVSVTGTGPARGLVANLLMVAEPITPGIAYSKKKKKFVTREPEVMDYRGMNDSTADVRVWATARTVTILFQNNSGVDKFHEWKNFCQTDRMQRLYLGL